MRSPLWPAVDDGRSEGVRIDVAPIVRLEWWCEVCCSPRLSFAVCGLERRGCFNDLKQVVWRDGLPRQARQCAEVYAFDFVAT